jgi:sugar lactone lactonase YvrE
MIRFATITLLAATLSLARSDLAAQGGRTVNTLAGPIEAGSGGVEVDAQGNIYTADFGATLSRGPAGTRIWRITPDGEESVYAEGFTGASGNTIGPDGWFYQSNVAARSVSRVSPEGVVERFSASGGGSPVGLVFDGHGNLLVANCGSNQITRISPDRVIDTMVASPLLRCPNGITRASDGNFYVANFGNGDVIKITPEGVASRFATFPGNNNGHLVFGNGVLYVVARGHHRLYTLTLDGNSTLLAGSGQRGLADGPALTATLSLPNDVALSPDGKILYWNDVGVTDPTDGQTLTPTYVRYLRLD